MPLTAPATPKGDSYDFNKAKTLWLSQGGPSNVADLMAHVAMAESSGNTRAENHYTEKGKVYYPRGLWQISTIHGNDNWFDPVINVRKAIELYNSQGMGPWEASRKDGAGGGWGQYAGESFAAGAHLSNQPPEHGHRVKMGRLVPVNAGGPVPGTPTAPGAGRLMPLDVPRSAPSGGPDPTATPGPPQPNASVGTPAPTPTGLAPLHVTPAPFKPPQAPPKGDPSYGVPGTLPLGFGLEELGAGMGPEGAAVRPAAAAAVHAYNAANHIMLDMVTRLKDSALDPLAAGNNVEQTPARFVATLINHGLTPTSLGAAFYNAFNPTEGSADSSDVYNRTLAAVHAATEPVFHAAGGVGQAIADRSRAADSPMTQAYSKTAQGQQETADAPLGSAHFRDFTEQFIAGSIVDPVTYFPVVDFLGRSSAGLRLAGTVADAAKAVGGSKAAAPILRLHNALLKPHLDVLNHTADIFRTRPELSTYLDPHARGARIGIEHYQIGEVEPLRLENEAAIAAHQDALTQIDHVLSPDVFSKGAIPWKDRLRLLTQNLPDELRQRVLGQVFTYGDDSAGHLAVQLGYTPTDADRSVTAARGSGYKPPISNEQWQHILARDPEPSTVDRFRGRKPTIGDRVQQHFEGVHSTLWKNRTDADTQAYINAEGGWRGEGAPDVKKLSYGPNESFLAWERAQFGPGGSPLRTLGRWGTQAVQGIPYPHAINNVGTLTYIAGGPEAIGRSIGYMARKPTAAQITRLKRLGDMAEYTADPGSIWSKLPLSREILALGQKQLSTMEIAYRQGMLSSLDRTLGPSVDAAGNITNLRLEMEKGQKIRDALVDYRNAPLVIAWLQAAGAPFAPFFGGLVKAVGNASLKHPDRVANVMRAENASQDQLGTTVPNPVSTFERLAFDAPYEIAERAGLVGSFFGPGSESDPRIESVGADMLRSAGGPWASRLPGFFNEPYNKPGVAPLTPTPKNGLLGLLIGAYPHTPPSGLAKKKAERAKSRADYGLFDDGSL